MKRTRQLLVAALTASLLSGFFGFAFAQSAFDAVRIVQDEVGFGTRALGMGGAYTGLANDYSAIYWNPAGLAGMKTSQFFGEVSHLNFNNKATFGSDLTDESQNYTRLRSLGFAFPLPTRRGSLVLAFGYNRVRDFDQNLLFSGFNQQSNGLTFNIDDQDYAFDQDVYQSEQVSDEGGLNQYSFGAGVAISPNFTAGVTATIWDGQDDYLMTFRQEDRNNNYETFPADFESYLLNRNLITNYSGFGLKFGAMFELTEGVNLGATIGLPTTFRVEETFGENDLLTFDDGTEDAFEATPGVFEYDVKTPFHFDLGASFSNNNVTLSGATRYRDWSQTRFDVPNGFLDDEDFVDLFEENNVIRQNYTSTVDYHVGAEVYLDGFKSKLRGGYAYYPSPLKNASSDFDKTFFSGGISFLLDRYVTLDLTYLRGSWQQESEDNLTPGGTNEEITTNKLLVGLTYKFK